jgi:PST family polysaccharide transporter
MPALLPRYQKSYPLQTIIAVFQPLLGTHFNATLLHFFHNFVRARGAPGGLRRSHAMLSAKRFANPDVTRAFANIVWLGLERVTQIVVAIAISGVLARYFGPDVFGKWQYANTLLLVLAPITWVCGAEILVPTIVHRPPQELGTVLGSAFALRIGVSAAALVLTWAAIAAGVTDPLVGAMLAGLAVTMLFREPFVGVINAWLQSITYSKPQLITSMATAIVKAALVFALARAAFAPASFGWLWALESAAIGAALVLYFRRRHGGTLGWRVDRTLLRHFATAGTVFWVGLICMYLFLKLDRLMLERTISFADLGRYSAAQQLNENWITLALMLAQTIAPAFVYRVQQTAQLRRNLVRLFAMTAVLMIAGAMVLDALAGFIISRVFGPAFAGAIGIFRWAVWLSVPAGIEAIGNLVVLKYQAKFVLLAKWVLALVVAFVANLIAIPRLGAYGALVGLAAGYVAAASVNFYYLRLKLAS